MRTTVLKPKRLRQGDLIRLIAPASTPASSNRIEQGVQYLERLGYRVKVGKHVTKQHGYLAGTDEERLEDLNDAIRDREARAIFALRGGYGTPRLLPSIDYAAVRKDPKIIVGYSDITALQLALYARTGLASISGPMVAVEMWNTMDAFTEEQFWRQLTSPKKIGVLSNPPGMTVHAHGKGNATGRLIGGNLALVTSNLSTPYSPSYKDALLFLEDIDEAPHRIDRMLVQFRNAGMLDLVNGVILGTFVDCVPQDPSTPHLTTQQVLDEFVESLKIPVLTGLQFGHTSPKLTIPIGLTAKISSAREAVEVLEGAVV
ncbi:MAG: LD-carboxypeptidase [Ignavibacteria bacterium]|nr:LD-carboxypeptidase [Ignavibacteria bacterium]